MSKLNYFIGKTVNAILHNRINANYKSLRFIPNGRFLNLDIKRSGEAINTIFDVGANIGQTALGQIKAYPQTRVYSFEPVKATYDILKSNTDKYEDVKCFNLALGDNEEFIDIVLEENTEINSVKNAAVTAGQKSETIRVVTGDWFCKTNNITSIDILKIDTEGYELEVLKGFGKPFLQNNVKFIYAETSFNRNDPLKTHYSDIDNYLTDCGFTTSGFYECFRWGKAKLNLGFCNVLFINNSILNS